MRSSLLVFSAACLAAIACAAACTSSGDSGLFAAAGGSAGKGGAAGEGGASGEGGGGESGAGGANVGGSGGSHDAATDQGQTDDAPVADTGGCTPSCEGRACGASDDCGGTCTSGTCAPGLHCVQDACICDPSSCSGCCSANTCMDGTAPSSCGVGGGECASCANGQSCTAGKCACGTQGKWTKCVENDYSDFQSCAKYCASIGKCCVDTCQSPGGDGPVGAWGNWFTSACSNNDEGSVASGSCTEDGWYSHFWYMCCCS